MELFGGAKERGIGTTAPQGAGRAPSPPERAARVLRAGSPQPLQAGASGAQPLREKSPPGLGLPGQQGDPTKEASSSLLEVQIFMPVYKQRAQKETHSTRYLAALLGVEMGALSLNFNGGAYTPRLPRNLPPLTFSVSFQVL